LLRFAAFEVNIEAGELRRYGHRIKLQGKPFQILVALLEHPGAPVSRVDLHRRLWSEDTFVDFDHNLNNAIDKLRKALNDSAEQPKFIETLPRRGYRFVSPVETYSAPVLDSRSETAAAEKIVTAELSSPSVSTPNLLPSNQARIDSKLSVPRPTISRRLLIIGSGLATCFLLALLFLSVRFFQRTRLPANSVSENGPEITSLVIEKNGALDPLNEGFKLRALGQYDNGVVPNASNHGYDRWKLVSYDQAYYYRTLTTTEKKFALHHDWKLTCICALVKGQVSANIDFGPGLRRFDIELLQEGDKYYVALTKNISPEMDWDTKIEFPGVADIGRPHTYELVYDHSIQTASLWIDGRLVASGYRGHTQYLDDRGLIFGTYSYLSAKYGFGVFRAVRFEVH
jgi:DNA-binding winged helix-turn-helix (wHTH) protein